MHGAFAIVLVIWLGRYADGYGKMRPLPWSDEIFHTVLKGPTKKHFGTEQKLKMCIIQFKLHGTKKAIQYRRARIDKIELIVDGGGG